MLSVPSIAPIPPIQIQIPQIRIPQIQIPQIQIPQIQIPQIRLPQIVVPQINVPQITVPQFEIESVEIPSAQSIADTQPVPGYLYDGTFVLTTSNSQSGTVTSVVTNKNGKSYQQTCKIFHFVFAF